LWAGGRDGDHGSDPATRPGLLSRSAWHDALGLDAAGGVEMSAIRSAGPGTYALRRHQVRYLAAAAALLTATIYALIGLGVLSVVSETATDAPPLLTFGLSAGAAYLLGAVLLLAIDRRIAWVLGAILQIGVIVMYIAVAPNRTPPYELWGITIKVLQALLLVALVYLSIRPPERADAG
jgi:hypothetical protein